jgi:ribonuclease HII
LLIARPRVCATVLAMKVVVPYKSGEIIVGIDEVGRGAWAGPLLMAAVVLAGPAPAGTTDSKLLTALKRQYLARQIKAMSAGIGLGWVPAAELDEIGLGPALKLAAERAVAALECDYDLIVIDGSINFLPHHRTQVLPKADLLVPAVGAASIVAKVARDAYMSRLHAQDPRYGFDRHVGYGTRLHAARLALHGPGPEHRRSFAPIRESARVNG